MLTSGVSQGPEAANNPVPGTGAVAQASHGSECDWTCEGCGRSFRTNIGLGVHKRRAHPIEANADAAPAQVKRRWRDEEVQLLARTEARLVGAGCRFINDGLMRELPYFNRSLDSIKGYRKRESYRSLVLRYLAELAPSPVSTGLEGAPDPQRNYGLEGAPDPPSNTGLEGAPDPIVSHQSASRSSPERPTAVPAVEASEDTPASGSLLTRDTEVSAETPYHVRIVDDLIARAEARKTRGAAGCRREKRLRRKGHVPEPTATVPVRLSARKRRRIEYARVQKLFSKCPSRAAAEVLDGQCRSVRHSLAELEAYWRPVMEAVSCAPGPTPEALRCLKRAEQYGGTRDYSQLWMPFTVEEVKASRVDARSAAGPDGILPGDWNAISSATQAEIFTAWLMAGEVPDRLRRCRTVFVPKTDVPAGPGEYRPITIASVPLRHMHSALARRLEAMCPPDARQRGFIRADGTLENSAVLDAVLGDCRKKLRECHVAVLDFAKAFDTVSHAALVGLLRERGLPEGFCSYVARLYDTAETIFVVNEACSAPTRVGQGVRQGDPLSPVLFNMAMDIVLAALPREVGYRLEALKLGRLEALAYADDLVLLAGSRVGLQSSIDCVVNTGSTMGLFVSHAKSAVLSMVPDGKRKKLHYLSDRTFKAGKRWLRQVSCVERWRYLGVDFKATGCVTLEHDLKKALNNITKAPLKPQQRLEIIRVNLIPRFLHGLVLGTISDDRLSMLDVQIRGAVRKWLRLPKDVPVGYFHAATKVGGLAIPSLRVLVPDLVKTRFGRLDSSEWSVA